MGAELARAQRAGSLPGGMALQRAQERGYFKSEDFRGPFANVGVEICSSSPHQRHILDLEVVAHLLNMSGMHPNDISLKDFAGLRALVNDARINMHPYSSSSANIGKQGGDSERSRSVSDASAVRKVFKAFNTGKEVCLTTHEADHIAKQPAVIRAMAASGYLSKGLVTKLASSYIVWTEKAVTEESVKFTKGKLIDQRVVETRLSPFVSSFMVSKLRTQAARKANSGTRVARTSAPPSPRSVSDFLEKLFSIESDKGASSKGISVQQYVAPSNADDTDCPIALLLNLKSTGTNMGAETTTSSPYQLPSPQHPLPSRRFENPFIPKPYVPPRRPMSTAPAFTLYEPAHPMPTASVCTPGSHPGPRCLDGSLDMRFSVNKGMDKYCDQRNLEVTRSPLRRAPIVIGVVS